jgi:hypothetical protein
LGIPSKSSGTHTTRYFHHHALSHVLDSAASNQIKALSRQAHSIFSV